MFSHGFGNYSSKVKVLTGHAPFKGSRNELSFLASSSFWWLPAVCHSLVCSIIALISTFFTWLSLALLHVFTFLHPKDTGHWISGSPPIQHDLILTTSAQTHFPNEATLAGSGD